MHGKVVRQTADAFVGNRRVVDSVESRFSYTAGDGTGVLSDSLVVNNRFSCKSCCHCFSPELKEGGTGPPKRGDDSVKLRT